MTPFEYISFSRFESHGRVLLLINNSRYISNW